MPRHNQSLWSRGMIPASGAGGPGFDSPKRPWVVLFADQHTTVGYYPAEPRVLKVFATNPKIVY